MAEMVQIVPVVMPEFEGLVPADIYQEATISLGVLSDSIPSGVLCLFFSDHRYFVSWFYVAKRSRRQGLGTKLMESVLILLRDIEEVFPVEMTFSTADNDLQAFFQAFEHFSQKEIGSIYSIDSKTRHESSYYSHMIEIQDSDCSSFFKYDKSIRDYFLNGIRLQSSKMAEYIIRNMSQFDPNLSLAYGKNTIRAVTFSKVKDKRIEIVVFHAQDIAALSMLFVAGIKKLEKSYPDYDIRITCFNDNTGQLVREFFGTEEADKLLTAVWDMRLPGEYPAFN